MHRIKADQLTARAMKQNYRDTVERFVTSDNAFSFMSFVKETLAYWKQFLFVPSVGKTQIFFDIILCRPRVVRTSIYYKSIKLSATKRRRIKKLKLMRSM